MRKRMLWLLVAALIAGSIGAYYASKPREKTFEEEVEEVRRAEESIKKTRDTEWQITPSRIPAH